LTSCFPLTKIGLRLSAIRKRFSLARAASINRLGIRNQFPIRIALIAPLVLLLAADSPSAPRDLAPMLHALAEKYKLPGVVGAILHGDQIVALGSTGARKVGDPAPFLPTDEIHLGSDTKAMTAMLIGHLIDKKQVTFDSTMRELFPDLAAKMNSEMATNTVRNLLDHAAGLPHDLDWGALARGDLSLIAQRHLAVEKALSVPPATPIGSYAYSNVGFVLLGAIIEAKTGQPWEEVMREEIFRPLHMASAGFGPPGTPGQVDEPWGHVLEDGQLKPEQFDNAPVLGPAGTVHCSIGDWSRFIAETLHGTRGHPTLLSPETFKELTTPMPKQNKAGGWIITQQPWADGLALTHAGSNGSWFCNVWIAPNKDFALLIAMNYGGDQAGEAANEGIGKLIEFNSHLTGNE
jgi:CubicO group peptidase (beta-lactamase class C family)